MNDQDQVDTDALLKEISRLEQLCCHPVFERGEGEWLYNMVWLMAKATQLRLLRKQVLELQEAQEYW